MESARILVVDDNDAIRRSVSKMLSRLGYEVSAADSGENGLNVFLRNHFDIVLSDYEMPGMDGVALACRIKQYSPGVAVCIMTGIGKEFMPNGKISEVDEVIAKPFSMDELDGTIRNLHGKVVRAYPDAASMDESDGTIRNLHGKVVRT
jgi:CheY-like chemotaxis protein